MRAAGVAAGAVLAIACGSPAPMVTTAPAPLTLAGAGHRVAGNYSGDDSCEGSFTGGVLTMTRQP
jgi:hypothetical protein